jgi:FkbM family methyltransferase
MASHNPVISMLRSVKQAGRDRLAQVRLRRQLDRFLPKGRRQQQGWVVIDVGANVGQTALQFERVARGGARPIIHSFEPFAANFTALQANTAGHPGIRCHRMAMGAEAATITVPLAPESQWHSIANQDAWRADSAASETIEVATLDTFAARERIDRIAVLKTDTEGYDMEVLHGARALLDARRIDLVICEVGFNPEDKQHTFFPPVFAHLLERGYRFCLLEDQMVYRSATWGDVPSIGYANAWFVSPSASAG